MKDNSGSKRKTKFIISILLLSLAVIIFTGAVSAANGDNIYVNNATGNDSWNGQSPTHTTGTTGPKLSIKNATGTVNTNGTVHIADGIYTGENDTDITIDNNMTIIGESQLGTIIDAQGSSGIFTINHGFTVTIQNLTLQNGKSSHGGAIYNDGGTLTISNCTFNQNTAPDGGALYNDEGNITVNGSKFTGNNATDTYESAGGAIYNAGNASVNNSKFTENISYLGGAIRSREGTLTVTNSDFTNNTAMDKGGAIWDYHGDLTVTNSIFTHNNATLGGGAIYTVEGNLTVTNSTFNRNNATAGFNGGAISNYHGTLIVTGSNFTENNAYYSGGAISIQISNLTLINSTFTGNTAKTSGGAISNNGGTLKVTSSTFTGNHVNNGIACIGGAIFNYQGNSTVTNSNFTNNTAPDGGALYNDEGNLTVTGSTFKENSATSILVEFEVIGDLGGKGGAIYNSGNLNVTGSTFKENTANSAVVKVVVTGDIGGDGGAIYNAQGSTLTVNNSNFESNNATRNGGALFTNGTMNVNVNFNRIVGNNASHGSAIYSNFSSVNAENNWWGSNLDPSKISNLIIVNGGSVDADPWMVLTVKANPNSLQVSGKSTLTMDLLHDSNGTYHDPKYGHVPDGLPVTFTATKGTINPSSSTLHNLSATSTFTASTSGVATVTAKVDNQTVPIQITIGSTKTTVTPVSGYATQTITLKATVTGSTVNEGQVQFKVGNITAGTAKIKNGVATLNWKVPTNWKPGQYTITTNYLGTSKYMASNGTSTFTLKPYPNLAYWQSINKGTHYYGDTIHYYLTIENHGPETISFSIYSKLPSGLKYVSAKTNRGSYKSNTWNTGTLKAGQTAKLDITAIVNKVGTITVKSTMTMSTWKGPCAIMTNSFNVPKAVPYAQLLKSSKDIKKYYETHNGRLPKSIKVAGQTLSMAQLLQLYTTATINFSKKNTKPIIITAVAKAPYPGVIYVSGELYNYVTIARNINTFINNKKRAPNYAQTRLGNIPFSKLVYMYAKVVNFYGKQNRLPNYVTTYKI